MIRARKNPTSLNDADADRDERLADLIASKLAAKLAPLLGGEEFARIVGAELRRTQGSLQENAAHGGFSESYFSKLIKEGNGPPVSKLSNNCSRIKFADTDRAIEALSGKGGDS